MNPENRSSSPSLITSFCAHSTPVCSISFDALGNKLASGGTDGTLKIWKIRPKIRAYILENAEPGPLNSVCFAPRGSFVAAASGSNVRLWTPELKSECRTIRSHLSTVRSVDVSLDSNIILTGSDDKTVKAWNVQPQRFLFSLKGHKNWIRCAKFSTGDHSLIASGGDDSTVKLWDFRSRECIYSFLGHNGSVRSVGFDYTGTEIVSSGIDDCLKLWDIRAQRLLQNHTVPGIKKMVCDKEEAKVAAACSNGTVKIFDTVEGRMAFTLHGHQAPVQDVTLAQFVLASVDGEGKIFIWRLPGSNEKGKEEDEEECKTTMEQEVIDLEPEKGSGQESPAIPVIPQFSDSILANSSHGNVCDVLNRIIDQLESVTEIVSSFDSRLAAVEMKVAQMK